MEGLEELADVSPLHMRVWSDEMGDSSWVVQEKRWNFLSVVGQRNLTAFWGTYHGYLHFFSRTLYNMPLTLSLDLNPHQWTWLALVMQPL